MGWPELLVCAFVGFLVFGPERLPGAAKDAARVLKQLRTMAQGAADELKQQLPERHELGLDELRELRDLHPKRMMNRALFDDASAESARSSGQPAGVVRATVPAGDTVPHYDVDAT